MGLFSSTKGKTQHRFGQMKQMLQDELREEARADAAAECHAEEAQCEAEDAPAGAADATEIMSSGEVVVEGVVVEEPAEPEAVRATTAGEVFGFSEQTVSVPPGDVGLTFDDRYSGRPLLVKEVAAGSPLFGRVQAGATLVAVDGVRATSSNIRDAISWDGRVVKPGLLDDDGAKTLIFQTGMDLGFTYVGRDRTVKDDGVEYVGREGIEGPLMSADAVVDILAMDRGHFDAANAAKARTHWLYGRPGKLGLSNGFDSPDKSCSPRPNSVQVQFCCVPPFEALFAPIACLVPALTCDFWFCHNCCYPHEDMAFPDWADRALVLTDKGVVGRQGFTGRVNAITWDGFRIEDVRIRTFDAPCLCSIPTGICFCCDEHSDQWFERDPLETACYFGFLFACCRCEFCQPEAPGLYRATISSIHHKREGRDDGGPMATIEVLALARSPDDLRSSLRAAKEKYGAPTAAEMAR